IVCDTSSLPLSRRTFLLLLFFFFQAEDGIRDATVTGVQTCALPILDARNPFHWRHHSREHSPRQPVRKKQSYIGQWPAQSHGARSEERRVGKECRCRGAR